VGKEDGAAAARAGNHRLLPVVETVQVYPRDGASAAVAGSYMPVSAAFAGAEFAKTHATVDVMGHPGTVGRLFMNVKCKRVYQLQ